MIEEDGVDKEELIQFVTQENEVLDPEADTTSVLEILKRYPISVAHEMLYVFDFRAGAITFVKGGELLGYDSEEVTIETIADFHPDDEHIVSTITYSLINYALKHPTTELGYFRSTYRLKKKDGTYIQVLRLTKVLEKDDQNRMLSNLSLLVSLEFMEVPPIYKWEISGVGEFRQEILENIYGHVQMSFTPREHELMSMICKGMTSAEIGKQLFISKHTVDTHRRNILRKSGCNNVMALQDFMSRYRFNGN